MNVINLELNDVHIYDKPNDIFKTPPSMAVTTHAEVTLWLNFSKFKTLLKGTPVVTCRLSD